MKTSSALTSLLLVMLSATFVRADEINPSALVEQLDAPEFAARDRAERALIERGETALPIVEKAARSKSPEVALRAKRIVRTVRHQALLTEFTKLSQATDDRQFDLETGLYLVARIDHPALDRKSLNQRLDALADEVRTQAKLIAGRRPATPLELVDATRHVLFEKHNFRGNETTYNDPANSSIDRVLVTQRGLPILLSQLTIAVGRRAGVRLQGLALPGRYMVWYQPPPGKAGDERIIDAFDGGKVLSRDDLEDLLASFGSGFDQRADLVAASNRETLTRVLRNLIRHNFEAGRDELATDCEAYEAILIAYDSQ